MCLYPVPAAADSPWKTKSATLYFKGAEEPSEKYSFFFFFFLPVHLNPWCHAAEDSRERCDQPQLTVQEGGVASQTGHQSHTHTQMVPVFDPHCAVGHGPRTGLGWTGSRTHVGCCEMEGIEEISWRSFQLLLANADGLEQRRFCRGDRIINSLWNRPCQCSVHVMSGFYDDRQLIIWQNLETIN